MSPIKVKKKRLRDANGHQFCRFEENRDHARERARLGVADA